LEFADRENVMEFPVGGFRCLFQIAPGQQIVIPRLGFNSVTVAITSGKVRQTIADNSWEIRYREGACGYWPGYEKYFIRNLSRKTLQLALIVPPAAD
jgi:hypothetical protein